MLTGVLNKLWANVSRFAVEPTKLIGMVTKEKFIELTEKVIDNLEGGSYHPIMKLRMSKRNAALMGDSGETMSAPKPHLLLINCIIRFGVISQGFTCRYT